MEKKKKGERSGGTSAGICRKRPLASIEPREDDGPKTGGTRFTRKSKELKGKRRRKPFSDRLRGGVKKKA